MTELPPFDSAARCPKCRYDAVGTQYWSSGHRACPTFGRIFLARESALMARLGANDRRAAEWDQNITELSAAMVEHLDRTCSRCRFTWSEAVVA